MSPGVNLERKPRSSKKAKPLQKAKGQTVLSNFCQIIRRSPANEPNCMVGDPISSNNCIAVKAECNVEDLKPMGNDDPLGVTLEVEDKVVSATSMTLRRSFTHDVESAERSSIPKETFGGDSVSVISSECEVETAELTGRDELGGDSVVAITSGCEVQKSSGCVEQPLVVEPKVVSAAPVSSDQLHDEMAQLCLTQDMPKPLKQDTGPTLPSSIQNITMETSEDGCMKSYLDNVPTRTVAKRSILEVDESSEIMPAARKKQKVGLFSLIALEAGHFSAFYFLRTAWLVWASVL